MAARILVIEDNSANMQLIRYLLEYSGYEVLEARDGAQGVAMALSERPDLVVCDIQLPFLDGYEVLRVIRGDSRAAGLKVVAVTAFSMPNDRVKVERAGFDGYFTKPIDPETFVASIDALLPAPLRSTERPLPP